MDPSEPGEKCLPEMGLSGWMKRTMERSYDLTDFCNSPPADGFFYPNPQKGNNTGVAGKGNCGAASSKREETRSCTIMGGVLSINQPISRALTHTLSDPSMYHHQTAGLNSVGGGVCNSIDETPLPGLLKPAVSGISSTAFKKQLSLGLQQNMNSEATIPSSSSVEKKERAMMRLNASSDEVRNWTNSSERQERFRSADNMDLIKSHPADDSAPTPVDHIVHSRYTPTIITTPADEGRSVGFVEKLGTGIRTCPATPDVTPSSTPAVTPACSPQVARRAGNPFFTGGGSEDDSNSSSGSWLFRPGKKTVGDGAGAGAGFQSDKLYEAKVEFQSQPNSKTSKKTVRYVPRPSELRELNFWSPTSM